MTRRHPGEEVIGYFYMKKASLRFTRASSLAKPKGERPRDNRKVLSAREIVKGPK